MMMAMEDAKIGRWMKKLIMTAMPPAAPAQPLQRRVFLENAKECRWLGRKVAS
jgi:hypothetical protein